MEVERQIYLIEDGEKIIQETRLYNGDTKESRSLRSKEEANDYRYFPCPDLLPVIIEDDYIEKIRKSLPELPDARYHRFIQQYELSAYDASILSSDRAIGQYFETAVKTSGDIKLTVNWILGGLSARLNDANLLVNLSPVKAEQLAGMIFRIHDGTISGKMAKQVFDAMWSGDGDADTIIKARGLKQVSDDKAIEVLVNEVLAGNPTQVSEFCKAEETKRSKMLGYFVGQIMKASKGQANPKQVNDILLQKLNGLP